MTFPTLTRMAVIEQLTNEQGKPLVVTPLLAGLIAFLDDPTKREALAWVKRQVGKSTAAGASAQTEALTVEHSYTVLIASSVDQQTAIFERKIKKPLERLLAKLGLRDAARFTRNSVEIPALNSAIVVLASNEATVPGRTATLLIIDEARDIPDSVYTALAPSVLGANGKIIVASTSGRPSGFFYQLVQNPTLETWLFNEDLDNPYADGRVLGWLKRRLGLISPAAAQRELENQFADDGDELIPWPLIEAAIDDTLGELPSSPNEAFAGEDLSRKRDLTSRVVVDRVPARRPEAADHLRVVSIATWNPKDSPTRETDFASVRADAARLPERFPNLRKLWIDEGAEGGSLLPFCRTHARLSLLTEGFIAAANTNMDIWSALSARLQAGTLSIPRHERLLSELRSLRRESFLFGAKWRVVDSSRKFHRDVSFSLALAVWAAGAPSQECPYCDLPGCSGLHLLNDENIAFANERRRQRDPNPDLSREARQIHELATLLVTAWNARQYDEAKGRQWQIDQVIAAAPAAGRERLEQLVCELLPELVED